MKKKSILQQIALIAILIIFVSACSKEKEEILESIQSAEDNAMIETEFEAVFEASGDVADLAGDGNSKSMAEINYTVLPSGALVIFTDSLWNDGDGLEFYIDYGDPGTTPPIGLLCKDGRYRAGRVDVSLSKPFYELNSVLEITISDNNDYQVGNGTNMTRITGTKTVTRTAENTRHIVVSKAQATNSNGTISWNADRYTTKTFDDGPGLWGDEFTLYGTAHGTNINGVNFTGTVEEDNPLLKKLQLGCASTFVAGVVTLENQNGGTLILDYDPYNDQACDKTAQVTINGKTRIISVR